MDIVVRRDLNMVPGLLAAQVLHIGQQFIRDKQAVKKGDSITSLTLTDIEAEWLQTPYVSVLALDTPEELAVIIRNARELGLFVREWKDVIPSKVFDGQVLECLVGVSIGPADSDALRKVTGKLPLY